MIFSPTFRKVGNRTVNREPGSVRTGTGRNRFDAGTRSGRIEISRILRKIIKKHIFDQQIVFKGFLNLVKTVTKKVTAEAKAGNKEQALVELQRAEKVIAKVGGKGILHYRAASRKISSLTRLVNRTS